VSVTFAKKYTSASMGLIDFLSNNNGPHSGSDSNSDSEYLLTKVTGKKCHPNHPSPFKSRILPPCPVAANKKRKIHQNPVLEYNCYFGALGLRQLALLLLAEADNANLRTDIVGFGLSKHERNQSSPVYHQGMDMKLALKDSIQKLVTSS